MSLRVIKKPLTVCEFEDEPSYKKFRRGVLRRLYSIPCLGCGYLNEPNSTECTQCRIVLAQEIRGKVFAKEVVDIICVEKSKPVSVKDFTEYAELIEAGCNALPRIMDELRDEFARDMDGNKIVTEDGEWLHKTPMLIIPLTATADKAWGAYNRAEGFATAMAMPAEYVETYKLRGKLIAGMQKSQDKQVALLKESDVKDPVLLNLMSGDDPPETLPLLTE